MDSCGLQGVFEGAVSTMVKSRPPPTPDRQPTRSEGRVAERGRASGGGFTRGHGRTLHRLRKVIVTTQEG